jgi:hypothetical protein
LPDSAGYVLPGYYMDTTWILIGHYTYRQTGRNIPIKTNMRKNFLFF